MSSPTPQTSAPLTVTVNNAEEVARVQVALLAPWPEAEVKVRAGKVAGTRCLALHYIDARHVMDRLDETPGIGIGGWRDEYTVLSGGQEVECRLSVRIAGEWVTKCDVGGESEQPDGGDRMKAAYSDALKRAAVKFGIGRYLYRLPPQWLDYDPVKKQPIRPGSPTQPKPAPPPANKPEPVSESAKEIAALFDGAKTRGDGIAPYKRFEAAQTAGRVTPADKAHIDAALGRFNKRLPRPQPAGVQ